MEYVINPFSVGCAGGLLTGALDHRGCGYRIGFALWLSIWTLSLAAATAGTVATLDATFHALGVALIWGVIPFTLCFLSTRWLAKQLRMRLCKPAATGRRAT